MAPRRRSVAPTPASSAPADAAPAAKASKKSTLTPVELLVAAWFALDAFTHICIEGLYLFLALQPGGAERSTNPLAFIWREYGRADRRWMQYADAEVLAVEFPTVLLMGPGALLCLYATLYRTQWKNLAIVLVSWCEIIGGWYTFASCFTNAAYKPELPSPLDTSSPWLFWVLLVFMNVVWVVVPGVLLFDAGSLIVARTAASSTVAPSAKLGTYVVIALFLAAYSVLVPVALLMAQ